MTEYVCMKLITGETVIGILDSRCEEGLTIEKPVGVSYDIDHNGNCGIKYVNYMGFSDETLFTFKHRCIILESKASDESIKFYKSFVLAEQDSVVADYFRNIVPESQIN